MNYEETINYLYERTPAFYQIGANAYKPGLERSLKLDEIADFPHRRYKTIHIAGTNGKGSVAHLISAVLQASGHKVGLYTSPHLIDFRERIKVNGKPISKQYVADFINKNIPFIQQEKPSFFEITSELAFDYFRHKKVDYAVIETGMGGRLDSTNIISPILSIITSISLDHTQFLGDTLIKIAGEKAGIIKRGTPVVIGDMENNELDAFFAQKALELSAPISFATEKETLSEAEFQNDGSLELKSIYFGELTDELRGQNQKNNAQTVLMAIKILTNNGMQIKPVAVRKAFAHVVEMTGLMARWQKLQDKPTVICDIGHNVGAWEYNSKLLAETALHHEKTHIIIGMVADKDVDGVLALMPKDATYYFTQASVERAMPVEEFANKAMAHGLHGQSFKNVKDAVKEALNQASKKDLIFIGGSTFVVADAYPMFQKEDNKTTKK